MECDKRVSDVHASLFALKLQTQTHVFRFVERDDLCSDRVNLFRSASFWSLSGVLLCHSSLLIMSQTYRAGLSAQVYVEELGLVYLKHSSSTSAEPACPIIPYGNSPCMIYIYFGWDGIKRCGCRHWYPLLCISYGISPFSQGLEVRMAWWFRASVRGILACLWNLHLLPIQLVPRLCLWFSLHWRRVALEQGCPILLLNGQHPAEFLYRHTCL